MEASNDQNKAAGYDPLVEESDNVEAEIALSILNAEIYEIRDNEKSLRETGELLILDFKTENYYCLAVNEFYYPLQKEIPVVMQNDIFVFPSEPGVFYGLRFSTPPTNEQLQTFEKILQDHANFTHEASSQVQQSSAVVATEERKQNKVDKFKAFTSKGSNFLKGTFLAGALLATRGMEKSGELLKKKLEKNKEETKVSEESKKRLDKAKELSHSALTFTRSMFQAIRQGAVMGATYVSHKVGSNQKANSIANHRYSKDAKEIGKATLSAVGTIYEGIEEALIVMGQGFRRTTVGVVDHKYGGEAAQACDDGMESAGNLLRARVEMKNGLLKSAGKVSRGQIEDVPRNLAYANAVEGQQSSTSEEAAKALMDQEGLEKERKELLAQDTTDAAPVVGTSSSEESSSSLPSTNSSTLEKTPSDDKKETPTKDRI
eukprot:CAMPEP_0115034766 /NCGR_PEP_ID=MMETSP0216-20121206/40896_1 /TAXON_ID=223996 /ORGANISM="Protocruzia adherens, Strain Boccale" /LENGTH=431 /DNA_ID=CAMNT_0002413813 /DNA_START=23 /DNA_END=1321 /DNA_ORIENTATION=-